jgi:hypothetical protein
MFLSLTCTIMWNKISYLKRKIPNQLFSAFFRQPFLLNLINLKLQWKIMVSHRTKHIINFNKIFYKMNSWLKIISLSFSIFIQLLIKLKGKCFIFMKSVMSASVFIKLVILFTLQFIYITLYVYFSNWWK